MEEKSKVYIKDRLEQYQGWYDNKAVKMKKRYLSGRIVSAISAVLIPIITNVEIEITIAERIFDLSSLFVTILGVVVASLIALEGVLHHKEQWKNYRTTEQFLMTQKHLFINRVEDYANLDTDKAFKLLVSRTEKAIAEENAITLNVMTRTEKEETL